MSDHLIKHGHWCYDCISRMRLAELDLGGDTSGNHKHHIPTVLAKYLNLHLINNA